MAEKRKDSKGRVLKTGESQRADGTYMFRYTDNSHKRQTIYAPTLNELREKEDHITAQKAMGACVAPNKILVEELVARYAPLYQHRRECTRNSYLFCEKTVLKSHLARMKVSEVQPSTIKAWLIDLYAEGYASNTIYQIGRYLGRVFNVAVEDNLIFKNPASFRFNFIENTREKRKPLSQEEQDSLLSFTAKKRKFHYMHDLIVVLLGTGLRIGELFGLTINDLDFEEGTITINKQLRNYYRDPPSIAPTKTQSGNRVLPMSDDVRVALKRMVDRQKQFKVVPFVGDCTGFIALDSKGNLNATLKFDAVLRTIVKQHNATNKLQLPNITAHIFRHTFATNMAHLGVNPSALQYLMGHSAASMTFDVYTHSSHSNAMSEARGAFQRAKEA